MTTGPTGFGGPRRFDLLLAEWVCERLASDDVPGLAVEALMNGCESPSVAVLAGLKRPTRVEVDDELPDLLREFGRTRPTELQGRKTLIDDTATRISDGDVDPVDGIYELWGRWGSSADDSRHPDVQRLVRWAVECECDDIQAADRGDPPPRPSRWSAEIVAEARATIARGGVDLGGAAA